MTPADAPDRPVRTAPGTEFLNGLNGVGGAAWIKSAAPGKKWGYDFLVRADGRD